MRSPDLSGRQVKRHRGVPSGPQLAPHDRHPSAPAAAGVLDDDDAGTALLDDSAHLSPEAGLLSVESSALAGNAEILTGEAAEDGETGTEVASVANIGNASCLGFVPLKDRPCERVELDLNADAVDEANVSSCSPEDAAACEEFDRVTAHIPQPFTSTPGVPT